MNKDAAMIENGADLEGLPDEAVPSEVRRMILSMMSLHSEQRFSSSTDKIAEKMTPEHITKLIENSELEDDRSYRAFKWSKVFQLAVFVIALVFSGFLLVFFRDSQHFITILSSIFSFLGGLGVGRFILPSQKQE